VRRLGHALAAADLDPELSDRLAATIDGLTAELAAAPRRNKEEERHHSTRYAALLEGRLPDATPHGAAIEFDRHSVVGGPLNPFGLGATHHRDGDEAVCTVTFGPAFEGPPGRVHGGAVALVVDEATATVLPMLSRFGFTGSVSVRLVAPAPLGVPVEFRSHLVGEEGRKLFVRCVGRGPEGTFVEAEAIYVQVDPATVPWIAAARARMTADDTPEGVDTRC
jgi:acyl-coenzyme A thioesterase PaaI-like protein